MSESGSHSEGETRFSKFKSRIFGRTPSSPQPVISKIPEMEEEPLSVEEELERVKHLPGITEALARESGQEKFVHANPSKDVAELINKNGLYCAFNGIGGIAQRIPEEEDLQLQPFVMRHNGYRYNSIITFPELPEDLRQPLREKNNEYSLQIDKAKLLRRELPDNLKTDSGNMRGFEYFLPAQFIEGYLDIENGEFTKNESYHPVIDEEEHERLKHIIESLTPESIHDYN